MSGPWEDYAAPADGPWADYAKSAQPAQKSRKPDWAKDHPDIYGGLVKTRELVGPALEVLGGAGGAVLGSAGGPAGTVLGAAAGYGAAKTGLGIADAYLGLRDVGTPPAEALEGAKNMVEGAAFEAGGRVVAPIIGRVAGTVADTLTGQFAKQRAAAMFRSALGPDAELAALRFKNAAPEVPTATVLADINSPTTQALLARASERDPRFFAGRAQTADETNLNALARLAGGETQTAAKASRNALKDAYTQDVYMPGVTTELNAANIAGRIEPTLRATEQRMGEAAANKVEDVRRFTAAAERAPEISKRIQQEVLPGQPPISPRYTYVGGDLAQRAESVAAQSAEGSLRFGEARDFAKAGADSLAAHGLTPLKSEPIVQQITASLKNPQYAGNQDVSRSLERVARDLKEWTNGGGVIDAWAVDSIRKNSVNATIRELYPSMDAQAQKALAAKVLGEVKPILVGAIERAGGTEYGAYLKGYADEMSKIANSKLGAEMMGLYKTNPTEFVRIVRGDNPAIVEKILGPGRYDLASEVGDSAMATYRQAADTLERSGAAKEQAAQGREALVGVLKEHLPSFRLPSFINMKTAVTNRVLDVLENKIGKSTMDALTQAAKNGANAEELLATLPARERIAFLDVLRNPSRYGISTGATSAMKQTIGAETINALAPRKSNQNALNQ